MSKIWVPSDLVVVPNEFLAPEVERNQRLRRETLQAYARMRMAALNAGVQLYVRSSYRSFNNQCTTFASKVAMFTQQFHSAELGLAHARRLSAEPGRSQHQLGTRVDIVVRRLNFSFNQTFAQTPEAAWLNVHAADYGFILSYPHADDDHDGRGYNARTGYFFEPWHWRYIGIDNAQAYVRAHAGTGILPDQFLRSLRDRAPL